jgi:type VI protein secretion system component Hcp
MKRFAVLLACALVVPSAALAGNKKNNADLPKERLEFNYGKVEWTYTRTDPTRKVTKTFGTHPAPKSTSKH